MLGRSNSGERGGLDADSAPMLTRRPSFSNWSMLSWRTRPRRLPVASCATTTARWYSRTSGVGGVRAAAPRPAPRCTSVRLPGEPERAPGLPAPARAPPLAPPASPGHAQRCTARHGQRPSRGMG